MSVESCPALVLNANFRPLSYFPLSLWPWQEAVKAVFQRLGAVAWGHSVAGLLEELAQKLPVPEALLDAASELDKAYIPSRYPDALPEGAPFQRYRRGEAERLLGHAEAVYAYCEGVLSQMDEGGAPPPPRGGA